MTLWLSVFLLALSAFHSFFLCVLNIGTLVAFSSTSIIAIEQYDIFGAKPILNIAVHSFGLQSRGHYSTLQVSTKTTLRKAKSLLPKRLPSQPQHRIALQFFVSFRITQRLEPSRGGSSTSRCTATRGSSKLQTTCEVGKSASPWSHTRRTMRDLCPMLLHRGGRPQWSAAARQP